MVGRETPNSEAISATVSVTQSPSGLALGSLLQAGPVGGLRSLFVA